MDELDMSGVDPLRWAEVRRRISVVKDFLRIASPTDAEQRDHAKALGLSVNQFMTLVRVWRDHGSAAKMAGSGAHRRSPRRPSRLAVPAIAKEEAAKVITDVGPTTAFVDIHREVAARCAALGVAPPSRSTLWNMVMVQRQTRRSGGDDEVVIATCGVRLPMAVDGGIELPGLTLAVRSGDGAVAAAAFDAADWESYAAAVATGGTPVRIAETLATAVSAANVSAIADPASRTALSLILGRGLDKVRLIYRTKKAIAPQRLLTTKDDRPLTRDDVRGIVSAAIARHNAARGAEDAVWLDAASVPPKA